ncbi:MAG TPA: hypothetical protein VJT73_08655 [Polyangiaceae bacterium]|nr:hypothetical protein [Polyangiaceae bacterium]
MKRAELGFDGSEALAHLRKADRALGDLIDRVGPLCLELKHRHSSLEMLAESIVYQQLTGKAAATIFGRFRALYGGHRFPSPEAILATPEPELRQVGLSRNKILAIRDLAHKVAGGTVPTIAKLGRMPDEEIVLRLTEVRGIGRWTAEMLLIFRLGRPDVLPIDDYGVRKGFALVFRKRALPTPALMLRHGERWRPFRTVASWYLWRALELPRETKALSSSR